MSISELHKAVQSGSEIARKQLFKKLSESFKLFVQQRIRDKEDAEEVVQEALMTIAAKMDKTEFTVSFASWAYGVLENKLLHYYRSKKYRISRFVTIEGVEGVAAQLNPTLKHKLLDCLRKIHSANQRHARILNLRYQGYRTEEICSRMGITSNNVYIILSRARSMLKRCLENEDSER